MNECLSKRNYVDNIILFLTIKEVILFSNCCKAFKKNLDPNNNPIINKLYLFQIFAEFFETDQENYFYTKKNLSGKKINDNKKWRETYINLKMNFLFYENKAISKKVLDFFCAHLYLQNVRNEIFLLESQNSSAHLIRNYDIRTNNIHTYNYYSKTITPEYIFGDNETKGKISILVENSIFQEELINFKNLFNDFINNENFCNFIIKLRNLDFEVIDSLYLYKNQEMTSHTNAGLNKIFSFILWITHLFIINTTFYCDYINEISEYLSDQEFITEYLKKKADLINISMLIDQAFDNINIIVNFLGIYKNMSDHIKNHSLPGSLSSSTDSDSYNQNIRIIDKDYIYNNILFSEKFSLYNYFYKIIEKYYINKLNYREGKFINLTKSFFHEQLNPQEKENSELNNLDNKMEIEEENNDINNSINEIKEDDDNDNDDFDGFDISLEETKESDKEIIENYCNSEVDDTINEKNSNGIMHTGLIINDVYKNNCEKVIINLFCEELQQSINNNNTSIFKLYDVIEILTHVDGNSRNLNIDQGSLALIRRTKFLLMYKSYTILFSKLMILILEDFKNRITFDAEKGQKKINIYIYEEINFNDYMCNMDVLTEDGGKNVVKNYEKEKENACNYLIKNCGINQSDSYLANKYMNNIKIPYVLFFKKVVLNFYKQLEIYKERDEKVIYLLSNKKKFVDRNQCFNDNNGIRALDFNINRNIGDNNILA